MAEDFRQKTQRMAMQYRDFWNEHQAAGMALGFVPVVSTVLGIADAAAAHNDERASTLEKTLSTAGILPFGKAASLIKGALGGSGGGALLSVVGPTVIKRAKDQDQMDLMLKTHYDPDFKTEVAEFRNYGTPNQGLVDVTNKTSQTRTVPMTTAVKDEPLSKIMPEEVGKMPVSFLSRRQKPNGNEELLVRGQGQYQWDDARKAGVGKMELGTGTEGLPMEAYDYNQIRRTAAHEVNHAAAGKEIDAGLWPESAAGSNTSHSGWVGYFGNLGEIDSYTTELRMDWSDELREAVKPWQTRRAVMKKIEENLKAGKQPNLRINELSNPETAAKYLKKFDDEGLDPSIQKVIADQRPNWNTKPKSKAAGSWISAMDFQDVVNLDPKIGQKMKSISSDSSWSARYTGPKTNHAKAIASGEQVEPLRAKVRWSDNGMGGGSLEVEEMDGLRRALAARNMFGSQAKNKIPVIFEPADDTARVMAADPAVRKGVRAAVDLMMEDDAVAPGAFQMALKQDY